jgi:hypothetical protein
MKRFIKIELLFLFILSKLIKQYTKGYDCNLFIIEGYLQITKYLIFINLSSLNRLFYG